MLTVLTGPIPIIISETIVPAVMEPVTQTITTTLPHLATPSVLKFHALDFAWSPLNACC